MNGPPFRIKQGMPIVVLQRSGSGVCMELSAHSCWGAVSVQHRGRGKALQPVMCCDITLICPVIQRT